MLSLTWLLAALFLSLRPSYVSAQNENSSAAAINFSKAVVQEASVSAQLQLANTSNPIPLPAKNPGNIPNYNSLLAMAGAWPPLPVAMGEVDVGQVVANMTPPSHAETSDADSSNNNRRQGGALRVLVVGDSMTHGSEGDYTWRYRMHEWFTSQGILYQFVGPYAGTIKPPEPTPPEKPLLYNAVALNPPPNVGGGYAAGAGGTPL
jgi:hypothetical protein